MRVFPNGSGLILGLIFTFVVSWIWPTGNVEQSNQFPIYLSNISIVLIFLIQGWNLRTDQFKPSESSWVNVFKVHGLIFLGPLSIVLLFEFFSIVPDVWISGFVFLAILPTTITSCVVYTSFAGGNSDIALGHATLSNFLSIIWVPVAWVLLINQDGASLFEKWYISGKEILPSIFFLVVLPVVAGWTLKNFTKAKQTPRKVKISKFLSFGCILLLVYFAMSNSVLSIGHDDLLVYFFELLPLLLGFLFFHLVFSWVGSGILCTAREVRVAEFYCIGQKSLAMGLPLLGVLSPVDSLAGSALISIPLIFYHFLQLGVGTCFFKFFEAWIKRTT